MAIPGSESSGSSHGGSPSSRGGSRSVSTPFARPPPSYAGSGLGGGDDDDDEPAIDPDDLWAPTGTPIPPATSECNRLPLENSIRAIRTDQYSAPAGS